MVVFVFVCIKVYGKPASLFVSSDLTAPRTTFVSKIFFLYLSSYKTSHVSYSFAFFVVSALFLSEYHIGMIRLLHLMISYRALSSIVTSLCHVVFFLIAFSFQLLLCRVVVVVVVAVFCQIMRVGVSVSTCMFLLRDLWRSGLADIHILS